MLYDIIRDAAKITRSVLVGFSGGKDSVATLDLCCQHFDTVDAYFMFLVPGLGFQERFMDMISDRFKVTIHRLPHWGLCDMLKGNTYRAGTARLAGLPNVKLGDIEEHLRATTGCKWFAYGHTKYESIERNAMLKRFNGIDMKGRRIYPLMNFTSRQVWTVIKSRHLPLSPDYQGLKRSFGALWPDQLRWVRDTYPEDFEKIKHVFPLCEAAILHDDIEKAKQAEQISEVGACNHEQVGAS